MESPSAAAALPEDAAHEARRAVDTTLVADLVARYPGSTSRELAAFSNRDRWQIARRLPEAAQRKRDRRVYKGRPRVCEVTGRMALTWWPREVPTGVPSGLAAAAQ